MADDEFPYEYFISRCGASANLAAEVTDALEAAGYRVKVQDYDFGRGGDFVGDIHDALIAARHLYILHTRDYDQNHWTRKEFTNFLAAVPASQNTRRVCLLRCDDSFPRGMLANVVFGELGDEPDPAKRRAMILGVAEGQPLRQRREPNVFGGSMPRKSEAFVGREDVFRDVKAWLAEGSATALKLIAISGLGGVGKTALARALVDRLGPDYAGVWWIAAETPTALVANLAALAARLDPKLDGEANLERVAQSGLRRIERAETPYLLVYDNVEAPDALGHLLPARGAHVLLTTRRSDWEGHARQVDLNVLPADDAVALLQARAGRKDEAGARRLAAILGYLPLAVEHAGAYCKLSMTGFDAYAKSVDKLIARVPKGSLYPGSVAATFALAIDAAARECAAAETLLEFCAFVGPERIPLQLLETLIESEDDRGEALMALSAVSLVRGDPLEDGEAALSLHRLVQAAARVRTHARGTADAALERVLARLAAAFPDDSYDQPHLWPAAGQLLPHALAARSHAAERGVRSAALAVLSDRTGEFLHGRASFALAGTLLAEAVALSQAVHGLRHAVVARSMNKLANVERNRGRATEAERLLRDALAIQVETAGEDHPDHARTSTSLAGLLFQTGRLDEAERLLRGAIASGETRFGRGHPDVATRMNNLAMLLYRKGDAATAEALLREAVAFGRMHLEPDHPHIADRLNNLAKILQDSGRPDEAEPLYRDAIASGRKRLGPDHPSVAVRVHNLANLLRDRGRMAEAEPLYVEAVAIVTEKFGVSHTVTARVRSNFAKLLLATERAEMAREEAKSAYDLHAQLLGPEHDWTKEAAATLAAAQASVEGRPVAAAESQPDQVVNS